MDRRIDSGSEVYDFLHDVDQVEFPTLRRYIDHVTHDSIGGSTDTTINFAYITANLQQLWSELLKLKLEMKSLLSIEGVYVKSVLNNPTIKRYRAFQEKLANTIAPNFFGITNFSSFQLSESQDLELSSGLISGKPGRIIQECMSVGVHTLNHIGISSLPVTGQFQPQLPIGTEYIVANFKYDLYIEKQLIDSVIIKVSRKSYILQPGVVGNLKMGYATQFIIRISSVKSIVDNTFIIFEEPNIVNMLKEFKIQNFDINKMSVFSNIHILPVIDVASVSDDKFTLGTSYYVKHDLLLLNYSSDVDESATCLTFEGIEYEQYFMYYNITVNDVSKSPSCYLGNVSMEKFSSLYDIVDAQLLFEFQNCTLPLWTRSQYIKSKQIDVAQVELNDSVIMSDRCKRGFLSTAAHQTLMVLKDILTLDVYLIEMESKLGNVGKLQA